MSVLNRFRLRAVIFAVLLGVFLLFMAPDDVAYADDRFACVTSVGADFGFGGENYYAVDFRDLGFRLEDFGDYAVKGEVNGLGEPALFSSVRELVDLTFYVDHGNPDIADYNSSDYLLKAYGHKFHPGSVSSWEGYDSKWVPAGNVAELFNNRRQMALADEEVVQTFSARWADPVRPGGGAGDDSVARLQEARSAQADLTVATRSSAGGGNRVITGTTEQVAYETSYQYSTNCPGGSGTVCTGQGTLNQNPTTITTQHRSIDQNNGEQFGNELAPGTRMVRDCEPVDPETPTPVLNPGETLIDGFVCSEPREIPVSPGEIPENYLNERNQYGSGSFLDRKTVDRSDDVISVHIVMPDKERKDLEYDFGGLTDDESLQRFGFGDSGWTMDARNRFPHEPGSERERDDFIPARGRMEDGLCSTSSGDECLPTDPEESLRQHTGYRTPRLESVHLDGNGSFGSRNGEMADIRWPVHFEDMNWYLYELPGAGYETGSKSEWLFWLYPYAGERLVQSFWAENAFVDGGLPECHIKGSPGDDADPTEDSDAPVLKGLIACKVGDTDYPNKGFEVRDFDGGYESYWVIGDEKAILPFDASDSEGELSDTQLVRRGVARALDADERIGARKLNVFSFDIQEGQAGSSLNVVQEGADARRRYGFSKNVESVDPDLSSPDQIKDAVHANIEQSVGPWPNDNDNEIDNEIDPNRPYLLVVTFYNVDHYGDRGFDIENPVASWESVGKFELPKRKVRRVVCRMMVYPNGFEPAERENFFERSVGAIKEKLSFDFEWLKNLARSVMGGISGGMRNAFVKTTQVVCGGYARFDFFAQGDAVPTVASTYVDENGILQSNAALKSREVGKGICGRVVDPAPDLCNEDLNFYLDDRCAEVPSIKLVLGKAEWVNPDSGEIVIPDVRRPPEVVRHFQEFNEGESITSYNAGLTEVALEFDFLWDDLSLESQRAIDGYEVVVYPDPKVYRDYPAGSYERFALPKYVGLNDVGDLSSCSVGELSNQKVTGIYFGTLGLAQHVDYSFVNGGTLSTQLSGQCRYRLLPTELNYFIENAPKGFNEFSRFIGGLPVAPGYVHQFEVRAYAGTPGVDTLVYGNQSASFIVNGNQAACDAENLDPALRAFYECDGLSSSEDIPSSGYAQSGLLALAGSNLCIGLFTATPPALTWDNSGVRGAWGLVWFIAGAVLFVLLVWQGLKMTYDVWLDPQPAVGFRELIPRFALALFLAAASLYICQYVLMLASDLTCFVSQTTGITMWGVVGKVTGSIWSLFQAFWGDTFGGLTNGGISGLSTFVTGLLSTGVWVSLILIAYILIAILLGMVGFAMLLRLLLLAVLIAVSPLAFAFYASDSTAHWTKRWVSMFLGATFQQVVVLLVLYLGFMVIEGYIDWEGPAPFVNLIMGLVAMGLVLVMALKVPSIVNPGGKGLFDSFGQIAMMSGAAAIAIGSAGLGAAAGGLGALRGGSGVLTSLGGGAAGVAGAGGAAAGAGGGGGAAAAGTAGGIGGAGGGVGGVTPFAGLNQSSFSGTGAAGRAGTPAGWGVTPAGIVAPGVGSGAAGVAGSPVPGVSGTPSGGAPSSGAAGAGVTTSGPGGAGAGRSSIPEASRPGFWSAVRSGAQAGWRRGTGFNVRAHDLMTGNSFYRHSSRSDDTARQYEESRADRAQQIRVFDRLAEALEQRSGNTP